MLRNTCINITLAFFSCLLVACDAEDIDSDDALIAEAIDRLSTEIDAPADEPQPVSGWIIKPYSIRGTLWAPCDNSAWGCYGGSPGFGNACLRPYSDDGLNICAPQTWDPAVADDCSNVSGPTFGLGVRLQGSAYCVPDCDTDADCGAGRKCSPASHFCAWVGQ